MKFHLILLSAIKILADDSPEDKNSEITNQILTENQTPVGFSCDFTGGLCEGWEHSKDGQFLWEIHNGTTISPNTGPDYDHTQKDPSGNYLLLEASNRGFLYKAQINTPKFNVTAYENYCFSFYYLMHGKHIFSLTIYSTIPGFRNPHKTMIFKVTGTKSVDGKDWKYAQMPIKRPYRDPNRLVHIIFDGVRGQSFYSDIAIDDVVLEPRECKSVIQKENRDLRTTPAYTATTTTTESWLFTTTTQPPPKVKSYLPQAYLKNKNKQIESRYCNPGSEYYELHDQICCEGYVISKNRGNKCCGTKPIYSKKQTCCQIDDQPTILLNSEFICCNNQKYDSKIYGCCNNQAYKLDDENEKSQACCKFKNGQQVKYDVNQQGCCSKANRLFNSTLEWCCGSYIGLKTNKNTKCCGAFGETGTYYMTLASDCCEAPVFTKDHYLFDHYNAGHLSLEGPNKYQVFRKFGSGCCDGIVYSKMSEVCEAGQVSRKQATGKTLSGPPAWLLDLN